MTAPDQPKVCVCGHRVDGHFGFGTCERISCTCMTCRPVLSWPDSEGIWWAEGRSGSTIKAACHNNKIKVMNFDQDEWWSLFGTTRFVKLLEPNPFNKGAER
jgi:hypothetical protein